MKMIFTAAVLLLAAVGLASQADAKCVKWVNGHAVEYKPLAVADRNGEVNVRAPTGQMVHVSGLSPYDEVCRNFLFKSLMDTCATPFTHFEGVRNPAYCKGGEGDHECAHIACDVLRRRGK